MRSAERSRPEQSNQARLARNLNELLQELRVAQTGVQILFAFLLSVVFTGRYAVASDFERWLHLATVLLATMAAALLIAPAAWHRVWFRRGRREDIIRRANRCALIGLALLAAAMTGAVALIAEVAFGVWPGLVLGALVGAVFASLWFIWPYISLRE